VNNIRGIEKDYQMLKTPKENADGKENRDHKTTPQNKTENTTHTTKST
jgi:hypothetical protein